jgi:hypothetical protein
MKRFGLIVVAAWMGWQQYQIHELRADLEFTASEPAACNGYDSCDEAITYLREDIRESVCGSDMDCERRFGR